MIITSKLSKKISLISFDEELNNKKLQIKYLKWLNDINIIKSIASPSLLIEKDMDFIYESFKRFTTQTSIGFFIKFNANGKYIGTCKLDQIDVKQGTAWDGIMIGEKNYQGKGLSIEVYKTLLDYAFNTLYLKVIYGGCSSYNIAMKKTFERIGYTHYEVKKNIDYIDGKNYDHNFFKIDKKSFNKINDN